MKADAAVTVARNERIFRFISYTLMFLMMVCSAMTIGDLIHSAIPDWHASVITGLLLFIVMDRLYTYRYFKSLTPPSTEWAISLGAQWLVLAIFMRLVLSYANGLQSFLSDLSRFAHGYVLSIFSPEFVVTLLLGILAWFLPRLFLGLLDEIGLDQKLALSDEAAFLRSELLPAHQRLVNLIFSVGILLVILTAMARLNLRATLATLANPADFAVVELGRFSAGEAGALFYFIFGLALLSLGRLMALQTRWNRQRISVSSQNLVRQWGQYSLVFLLALALIVSVLPAGDSLGFLSLVSILFGFLFGIFAFLAELIIALLLLLVSLPFLLFGKPAPLLNRSAPPPVFPTPPPQVAITPTNNATWELIKSILLWGSLVLIIVFSLVRFLRQHDSLPNALRKSRVASWLVLAWQWLRGNIQRTQEGLSRTIMDGWKNLASRLEGKHLLPRSALVNIRSLDPRRRIYFFYFAMIRRGSEQGLTRAPSQTPSEYAATLEKALPSSDEDIHSMTDAFVEARYSRRDIGPTQAERVKAAWGRIRRALRSKLHEESSENK